MDLPEADAAKAAALLGADVLARVRGITDAGASAEAHRGIVRAIGAGWKPDHGADKAFDTPKVWEEFVATAMRAHKGSERQVHREHRLDHARTVLATRVPVGPYEHVDLEGNPVPAMRRRYVDNHASVAFVRILATVDAAPACPVRSALWTSGERPAWVARPIYDLLREAMDVTPLAVMVAPGMRPALDHLPDAAKAFLDRADPKSWADGVVAEAVWRSGLSSAGPGTGAWQAGLPASYLRAVDLAAMCREAVRLRDDGASVSSYGLGWVRYTRPA